MKWFGGLEKLKKMKKLNRMEWVNWVIQISGYLSLLYSWMELDEENKIKNKTKENYKIK